MEAGGEADEDDSVIGALWSWWREEGVGDSDGDNISVSQATLDADGEWSAGTTTMEERGEVFDVEQESFVSGSQETNNVNGGDSVQQCCQG